jgi:hypothetical protein
LPNQNDVMNNEPPRLSGGDALVPSNGNNYQSKVDANYSLDDSIWDGTETSASLEFLHHETILDQFPPNGVWGVFITTVKFLYNLYRLNSFFFLARKVKFRRLVKWWGKKFK